MPFSSFLAGFGCYLPFLNLQFYFEKMEPSLCECCRFFCVCFCIHFYEICNLINNFKTKKMWQKGKTFPKERTKRMTKNWAQVPLLLSLVCFAFTDCGFAYFHFFFRKTHTHTHTHTCTTKKNDTNTHLMVVSPR